MIWLICAALVLLSGYYVLAPLFGRSEEGFEVELLAETELDRLLDSKAVIYKNIQDLEFEHKMGRLSDADYKQHEAGYRDEAAAVLQKIEQLGAGRDLDESIEKEIALHRPKQGRDMNRCPSCGAETAPGKKFCADCGHQL